MQGFYENINIQTLIGLFILVLCFVIAIVGFLLWRYEFLDGKSFFFSRILGVVLVMGSVVLAVAVCLMLIYVRVAL